MSAYTVDATRSDPLSDSTNLPTNEQLNAPADPANQGPLAPIKSSLLRKLFIGTDGLRAGWSLLIFIALMAALLKGVSAIANFLHLLPQKGATITDLTPGFTFFGNSLPFLATLLVTWIMSKIESAPTRSTV